MSGLDAITKAFIESVRHCFVPCPVCKGELILYDAGDERERWERFTYRCGASFTRPPGSVIAAWKATSDCGRASAVALHMRRLGGA